MIINIQPKIDGYSGYSGFGESGYSGYFGASGQGMPFYGPAYIPSSIETATPETVLSNFNTLLSCLRDYEIISS